jgi:hypothetical protein
MGERGCYSPPLARARSLPLIQCLQRLAGAGDPRDPRKALSRWGKPLRVGVPNLNRMGDDSGSDKPQELA